jgi:type VI secretion system protein ImpK
MSPSLRGVAPHNLAACYQELFSLAAHIGAGRQVGDPERFSADIRGLLRNADATARALGYAEADVETARFALVALLDDVILNSTTGTFMNWANNPLAVQIYQKSGGGARFFDYLGDLLQRSEDPRCMEVLEVYLQCLLLGFRGQFGHGNEDRLYAWREPIIEKLHRVLRRGRIAKLAADWNPQAAIRLSGPPQEWTGRLRSVVIGVAALIPVTYIIFHFMLSRGVSSLTQLAGR